MRLIISGDQHQSVVNVESIPRGDGYVPCPAWGRCLAAIWWWVSGLGSMQRIAMDSRSAGAGEASGSTACRILSAGRPAGAGLECQGGQVFAGVLPPNGYFLQSGGQIYSGEVVRRGSVFMSVLKQRRLVLIPMINKEACHSCFSRL